MPLTKIQFRPGVNRESTSFANEQGWFDSNLIRFRKGRPEKMGGWSKALSESATGVIRSLKGSATLSGLKLMGVGTSSKFYIEQGGSLNDVTPIRSTATLGANPFTTGDAGSGVLTVVAADHGAAAGDFVTFSGATTFDGITIVDVNRILTIVRRLLVLPLEVGPLSLQITKFTWGQNPQLKTLDGGRVILAGNHLHIRRRL